MPEPNERQRELIDAHEGIYLVDAGPGTGKTFTITRRYASIIDDRGIDPSGVLLLTFTNAAADEMTDRIIEHCDRDLVELADAPIGTFHSRCNELLRRDGLDAPRHLGIEDDITATTQIVEDAGVERLLFEEFYGRFVNDHPQHAEYHQLLRDPMTILSVLNQLMAKGIIPTNDGWYRDSRSALQGDRVAFDALIGELNRPNQGANGATQSDLRSNLAGFGRDRRHAPEAPSAQEIRGERGTTQVDVTWVHQAFNEDRESLVEYIHDLYVSYLEYALGRNILTFGMLQIFAFVMLCEDDAIRTACTFDYVMIDEFQDTSEIQFKLALLLLDQPNLCVVGDWKQSIYAFQYADVGNITEFEDRLQQFVDELNRDRNRVDLDGASVTSIPLEVNYRSPQAIIDLAEDALTTPATGSESIEDAAAIRRQIVSLTAESAQAAPQIEAVQAEAELEAVISKIQHIVGNEHFAIDGGTRPPTYGDIAVLSRTHSFGRELHAVAKNVGLPVVYGGDIELFDTDEAKLVLAWLRILSYDDDRGWALVLEQAGYTVDAIDQLLKTRSFPMALERFKEELKEHHRSDAIARSILERYGFGGEVADSIITTIRSIRTINDFTLGDVIRYLERGIDQRWTRSVDGVDTEPAVTIQTIHSAKGLEFPIVIMANMNRHAFPSGGRGGGRIRFDERVGLRQTHEIASIDDRPHRLASWRWDLLNAALMPTYDEERRLLYVALTRAKDHLVLTAGDNPNQFFEELPVELVEFEPAVEPVDLERTVQTHLGFEVPAQLGPRGISPHDLMDQSVFDDVEDGRGVALGREVHDFAEAYVNGTAKTPSNEDEHRLVTLIDGLDGECEAEVPVYLPLTVGDRQITLFGYVDLLHRTEERIEIIDFKTDATTIAQPEYRKQLSVYYHVLEETEPDKEIVPVLYYTYLDQREQINPLSRAELAEHAMKVVSSEG